MKIGKTKKTVLLISLFVLAGIVIFGIAGRDGDNSENITLYFLNSDKSDFAEYRESISAKTEEEFFEKTANALLKGAPKKKYSAISNKETKINKITNNAGKLTVDFSKEFDKNDKLSAYSVIKTFCGIPGIKSVCVTADGEDILGSGFISGDEINLEFDKDSSAVAVLYFADNEKNKLIKEYRKINVTDKRPIEQYIVNELIKGPSGNNTMRLFPDSTGVISAEITDGTCYVNFEKGFEQNSTLDDKTQRLLIYSLVNSLTEREDVKNVQILVDGKKSDKFTGADITGLLLRNEKYIK